MKILLLTTHLNLGGIGIYVLTLARGLVQKGHQVFVASCGGDLVAPLESSGARHLTISIKTKSEIHPKVYFASRQISRLIREKDIEIIHAQTRVAQVLAERVSQKTAVPYITTCHGFFKPRLFRRIFPCWGRRCIAISEAVRADLVHSFGVQKERIVVVHNGIEIERFSPDKFSQAQKQAFKQDYGLSLKSEARIIGTVARLSQVKGQCYLVLAMKRILKSCPQAQLLLVGDGPEKERLVSQTQELGIEDRVFFRPATLDTSIPLSMMNLFVFPSLSEGLGLAIIEAQAMGLAVVASDVGGVYTLVEDSVNGFLVQPKEPQALAEKIIKVLKNERLAKEMGTRAREKVLGQFNLAQMIDGIERVYLEVANI